jgi:hypothetical protein
MLMIVGLHLLGLACAALLIIPALRDTPSRPVRPPDSDDGWGHGPRRPPLSPRPPKGGIPLPDADQARVRLRDHGRLADGVPKRDRRPSREPERKPART